MGRRRPTSDRGSRGGRETGPPCATEVDFGSRWPVCAAAAVPSAGVAEDGDSRPEAEAATAQVDTGGSRRCVLWSELPRRCSCRGRARAGPPRHGHTTYCRAGLCARHARAARHRSWTAAAGSLQGECSTGVPQDGRPLQGGACSHSRAVSGRSRSSCEGGDTTAAGCGTVWSIREADLFQTCEERCF